MADPQAFTENAMCVFLFKFFAMRKEPKTIILKHIHRFSLMTDFYMTLWFIIKLYFHSFSRLIPNAHYGSFTFHF